MSGANVTRSLGQLRFIKRLIYSLDISQKYIILYKLDRLHDYWIIIVAIHNPWNDSSDDSLIKQFIKL